MSDASNVMDMRLWQMDDQINAINGAGSEQSCFCFVGDTAVP